MEEKKPEPRRHGTLSKLRMKPRRVKSENEGVSTDKKTIPRRTLLRKGLGLSFRSEGSRQGELKLTESMKNLFNNVSKTVSHRLSRMPSNVLEVNEKHIEKLRETLPPLAPDSLDGTGKRDISMFATTWNMNYCEPPSEDVVKYWLPKSYDIYVIALQCCNSVLDLSKTCIEYLSEEEDTYEEFMDFLQIQTDSITEQNTLILLFLVHSSLLEEGVFKRSNLKRQKPQTNLTSSYTATLNSLVSGGKQEAERRSGGVLIMQFEVFDTAVLVVNAQLTKGMGRQRERIADIRSIVKYINSIEADHVIFMGDMGIQTLSEFVHDDDDIIEKLKNSYAEGKGWGEDRFAEVLKEDEVSSILRREVKSFREFAEIPINFPPTSARRIHSPKKRNQPFLAERFHEDYDLASLYQKNGTFPTYNERIFFKTLYDQHKPGFKAFDSGSCEGVTLAANVPIFTTFRVGNKTFSIPEEEYIKDLVDSDDLVTITNELEKFAPEEVREALKNTRDKKSDLQQKVPEKLFLNDSDNDPNRQKVLMDASTLDDEYEDEEEEEENEAGSGIQDEKPNNLFRPNPALHRPSYVTVFDLLSLPPPPAGSRRRSLRESFLSSASNGPPPPPIPKSMIEGDFFDDNIIFDDDKDEDEEEEF